jgi:serine/threonine-protein kinase HipA
LKLTDRIYETGLLKGVFGALRDASPDHWGRLLIDRHLNMRNISEMDYLLHSPDDRIGTLGFGLNKEPPASKRTFNRMIDLEMLQQTADEIMQGENAPNSLHVQVEKLLLLGTSMGGARPKTIVSSDNDLWIAKFNCHRDRWNSAIVEHFALQLARECGLTVAESKITTVAGKDVLLVRRFDREYNGEGYMRRRMISAMTILRTDENYTHRDLAMICGNQGRFANRNNLLSECRRFMVEPDEAATIIDEMKKQVKNCWYRSARKAGVSERDCDAIKSAFAYSGFFAQEGRMTK